ncbi:MAG TPA: hypothetical protein VLF62_02735 [Candidatus Saccharimonadales bacterium]|nr:hypothetical protein [Candidatus Saccharimonadales bacterium]
MTETSVIHPAKQRALRLIGSAGIRTAAATAYETLTFAPPEWHRPQETYLDGSKAAWKLGEACIGREDVQVLVFRNATLDEVCSLQVGIQTGYEEFVAAGRDMLCDKRGGEGDISGLLDHHREIAMGRLIVPLMNSDDLTPAMLARVIAEPAQPVYGQVAVAA